MSVPTVVGTAPIFEAEPPEKNYPFIDLCYRTARLGWNLFSIIVYPIALARLTIWFVRSRAFALAIIPGTPDVEKLNWVRTIFHIPLLVLHALYHPNYYKLELDGSSDSRTVVIKTPDGGEVHGAFFEGRHKKKVVINAFGNGARWELLQDHVERFAPLGVSVMMVNPRGVGKSQGSLYEEGYALDIYSAYEYLIHEKGIDPEDIVIVGESAGAAYGTCGAALIQEKYPDKKISAINSRSFSHLGTQIDEMMYGKGIFPGILRLLAKPLRFRMDVKEAFQKLKGKRVVIYHKGDEVVPYAASLAKAIKESGTRATLIEMHNHFDPRSNIHNRPYCKKEEALLLHKVGEILQLPVGRGWWTLNCEGFFPSPICEEEIG